MANWVLKRTANRDKDHCLSRATRKRSWRLAWSAGRHTTGVQCKRRQPGRALPYGGDCAMARVAIGFPLSTADAFIVSAVSGT